ncbi:MAG: hypothetical protein PHD39_09205, partial [Methylobacter tundripaludum]|nr:hypothetical protein [Methylobacter tundripaludum]
TVTKLLEDHHIERDSHKWRDYENAKFYLEELDLDSIEYHDACVIIREYVGVVLTKEKVYNKQVEVKWRK